MGTLLGPASAMGSFAKCLEDMFAADLFFQVTYGSHSVTQSASVTSRSLHNL